MNNHLNNISIIVAMTKNKVIGANGSLPWKIKEELQYFKKVTLNKVIIMGSNTFKAINCKPLPARHNIVLTRKPEKFKLTQNYENLSFVTNIEDGLQQAMEAYTVGKVLLPEIMIIGGKEVYNQFLPSTSKLYLSIIKNDYIGEVYFPDFDVNEWKLISSEEQEEFITQTFLKKELLKIY